MNSPGLISLCAIFLMVIKYSDPCLDTYAENGDQNVQLVFDYNWNNIDTNTKRRIVCLKETTYIGECIWLQGARCSIHVSSSGVYTISSNGDYTSVYINITEFNEETAGEYSCSRDDNSKMTTICIKTTVPLTSLILRPPTSVSYPIYNTTSTFECFTSESRPVASIQWFVDDRNITEKAIFSYNTNISLSILEYSPASYIGGNLSCTAHYVFKTINISLTKSTRTYVQSPVSRPVVAIDNVNVTHTVNIREGRPVQLKCSSYGYPPPSYRWTYPGGELVGEVVSLQFRRFDGNLSCKVSNTYLSLDGTINTTTTVNATSISINVLYPPSIKPFINKDLGKNNIRVIRGDNISVICESDANPLAAVYWKDQQINSSTLTVPSIQHDTVWTCSASNTILETDGKITNESVTRNLSATVLYGPAVPTVMYSILPHSNKSWIATNETIRVIEGSTVTFMCSVNSIPTSIYSWGIEHEGSIRNISNVTRTTDTSYTCTVNNVMDTTFKGNITGSNFSSVNLHVLYGPDNIIAKYNNITGIYQVLKVIEGSTFTISCFASGNPAPSISWYGPGEPVGNVLFTNNVSTYINKNITCTTVNTMVDSVGHSVSETAHLTFTLDVLYAPVAQRLQNQSVLLNTSLTVTCNLTNGGNPPASHFTWIRTDTRTVVGTGQTLTINNIGLSAEGEYQCNASNIMQPIGNEEEYGFSQSTVYINVEYGAYIQSFEVNKSNSTIVVDQDGTVNLVCDADGDPEPAVRIVNATRENETILTVTDTEKKTATYHIPRARCEYDAGAYKCVAKNTYNHEQQEQLLVVFVKCSPRASPFSPPITDVYKALNDSAVFTFTIMAYPAPKTADFTWLKRVDDKWMVLSSDSNILINISDDKMQTYLKIVRVQVRDYAEYSVNVSNTLGSTMKVFTLHAQSRPEVPKGLHVSQVGKTELVVAWVPGFNGGEDQNFTIRYKKVNIERWSNVHIASFVNNYTWTLEGLHSSTTYQVQMLAENKVGKSDWSEEIRETTLVDAGIVDKGSATPAIGGAIGAAAGISIIVVGAVVMWRKRTRALQQSDAKQILTKRSNNHANGTYENIGMFTPSHERKITKHATASLHSGNERQTSHEHARKLAPNVSKNNMQSSEKHAVKSAPVKYEEHGLQNNDEKTAPTKNDIHKFAEKSIPLTETVKSSQTKETVIVYLPYAPIATPSKDKSSLHRRNSLSIEHNSIYENLYKTKKQFKHREISVQNLRETVVRDKDNKTDVFNEYSALNVASEKLKYSTNAAMKPANTSKNRYKNLYPYDKNRVTLSVIGNDIDADFINASFIDGYSSPKKYIAAQGPLAGTRADLWRLIWEKNIRVVVMVTNLVEESKRKCFQYWPTDAGNDCQYGDFTIHLLAEETYADFVIRTLQCTRTGSSKTVTHLHFTAWPDKDVPDTALSLMQFWRKVRSVEKPVDAPWIVHCSAGVGRTGTFIALDYLYEQGVSEKQINVFDAVLLLREQRINMVQTKNQYLYLHEVLCEALCPVGEVLSNKAYLEIKRTSDYLNQEYKTICQSHIPDREEETVDGDYIKVLDGEKTENMNKNVDPCVVPDDKYRPVLNAINTKGHTDYINAVYISTFQEGDRLILTQSANTSSDIDFVRLLHDHFIRTVVTLGDQVEPYLPESGETIVIGPFTASSILCSQKQHFQEYVVRFKHIGERDSFDVHVFRFTKWSKQFDVCNTNELLSLLTDVQERAFTEGPVGIQCRDGYSRSGLVAVLWCLMERSKRDGEVAVAETLRLIRRRREQVITNEAQYRFCHEFMKEYVEGCLVYANT